MALQRTPPKFSSNPDISASTENDNYVNLRKRKQPDSYTDDSTFSAAIIDQMIQQRMTLWDEKITSCISAAVSSAMTCELSKITESLSSINASLQHLKDDNTAINRSLSETNLRLAEMEKSLTYESQRQDTFDDRLKVIEDTRKSCVESTNQVHILESKIAAIEQHARQNNVEISNLPERRGENLIKIIECLGNEIKYPISAADIVSVHRVPHADQKNPRPKNVIVTFTTRIHRDNVIAAHRATKGLDSTKLSINGSPHTIYINEHLTLANKMLFRQTREAARKQEYKYVWIKHGCILVRKSDTSPVLAIRSLQDVDRIK